MIQIVIVLIILVRFTCMPVLVMRVEPWGYSVVGNWGQDDGVGQMNQIMEMERGVLL